MASISAPHYRQLVEFFSFSSRNQLKIVLLFDTDIKQFADDNLLLSVLQLLLCYCSVREITHTISLSQIK